LEIQDSLKEAIVSYYDGKLTQSQSEDLLSWVHQNEENLNYFRQIGAIWYAASSQNQQEFNSTKALKEIREKIDNRGIRSLPPREIRMRLSTLYRVAAAVIILVALGITGKSFLDRIHSSSRSLFVETSAPKGSRSFIILPDSTTVWLNAGTKFRYAVDYGNANRIVYLEGEAYFKVSKNKKLPFKVYTSDITVTALGTAFNVKAYKEEGTIETTLEEGIVRIEDLNKNRISRKLHPVILKPKQSAIFHKLAGNMAVADDEEPSKPVVATQMKALKALPMKVSDVPDTRLYTSWKDERWIFKNENLSSLVIKLERRYDVNVVFMDKALEDYAFSGTLLEESLEQVLAAIRYSAPIRYEINAKEVRLYEDKKIMYDYRNVMNP
jgi:transmembrane sensor